MRAALVVTPLVLAGLGGLGWWATHEAAPAKPHVPTLAAVADRTRTMTPASGAIALATWLAANPSWSALTSVPETTMARAAREEEADAERGRRACDRGTVVIIKPSRAIAATSYEGMLMTGSGLIVFLAVGNADGLAEMSRVRFCGIVTGRDGPLVGMFAPPDETPPAPAASGPR